MNWTYWHEAVSGYVVYIDDTIVNTIGGSRNEYTLYGLIPGTSHSVAVRAYIDVLGPPGTIVVTTIEGTLRSSFVGVKNLHWQTLYTLLLGFTAVSSTLVSPRASIIQLECHTNVLPDTISITMDGTARYTPTQQLQHNGVYISRVNATIDALGESRDIQCVWSVNSGHFTSNIITIEGISNYK